MRRTQALSAAEVVDMPSEALAPAGVRAARAAAEETAVCVWRGTGAGAACRYHHETM